MAILNLLAIGVLVVAAAVTLRFSVANTAVFSLITGELGFVAVNTS